jgi:hypothetical protein
LRIKQPGKRWLRKHQLSLIEHTDEGERLRDEAIARVEVGTLSEFVCDTIARWPSGWYFTTDDIWPLVPDHLVPREPRAMGAAMVRARNRGLCQETPNFQPTRRPRAHKSPQRIWVRTLPEVAP